MQQQINELLIKIEYLEKMINGNQQYLILTWTILGVVVAIVGIALFFLAKIWVVKTVENQLAIIKNNILSEVTETSKDNISRNTEKIENKLHHSLKQELREELLKYIEENKQFYKASGSIDVISADNKIYISGLLGNTDGRTDYTIVKFELVSYSTNRKIKHTVDSSASGGMISLSVTLLDYDRSSDGLQVKWNAVWINESV